MFFFHDTITINSQFFPGKNDYFVLKKKTGKSKFMLEN